MNILLLFLISVAWSQNRVGNGGDVIKCPKKAITLDLYESSQPLQVLKVANEWDYAERILSQLSNLAPSLENQYKDRLKSLKEELEFRSDISLKNVKDSLHWMKPSVKECKLLQIAIRRDWSSTVTARFQIDKALWEILDAQNKASLLTHEIIYEHFYKLGEFTSVKARELNRWLYEERFQKVSKKEFWNFIKSTKLPIYQN